jgi:hypothetical protein
MHTSELLETFVAALLFAGAFLVGKHVRVVQLVGGDSRSAVSFGAGMAISYAFVHVMPELQGVRVAFASSVAVPLRFEGMAIYFVALVGFLLYYGLDHFRKSRLEPAATGEGGRSFRIHIGGFAAYVLVMSYLLVHNLDEGAGSTALYAVAITFHFVAVDHSLRDEHGEAYERIGRWVLAGMALLGWGLGILFALPNYLVAPLMAFLSGSIILNSTIMELPGEKGGRFWAFAAGAIVYGLILLPLG